MDEYINFVKIAVEISGKNSRKLKTDVYNEVLGKGSVYELLSPNCSFIDINEKYCKIMKKKYPESDVRVSDIRNLCFSDKKFDLVLDLSTIDHILDYKSALLEYKRVLKPNGLLALAVWTTDLETKNRKKQYWHNYINFDNEINKIFNNIANYRFVKYHGKLLWYLMRNK